MKKDHMQIYGNVELLSLPLSCAQTQQLVLHLLYLTLISPSPPLSPIFKRVQRKKKNKMYCLLIYSHSSKCPASCWFEGWFSLTTTIAPIPPTQERMAWHLPELQGSNTFFLKWQGCNIQGWKDPCWAPTGTLSHWHTKPIQMGAVITGIEAKLN